VKEDPSREGPWGERIIAGKDVSKRKERPTREGKTMNPQERFTHIKWVIHLCEEREDGGRKAEIKEG